MAAEKETILDAGKFIAGTAVGFLFFSFVFSVLPLEWFELIPAIVSARALGILGMQGWIEMGEPVLVYFDAFSAPLGFSYLCTGLLELSLIMAAILSSFGISIKKRLAGALGGIVAVFVFNSARVLLSVLALFILGMDAGNFAHDIFFRLFLITVIAGYYYAWFSWATGKKTFSFMTRGA